MVHFSKLGRLALCALLLAWPIAAQEQPFDLAGTLASAAELREDGQWSRAEQLLRDALRRAPYSPELGLALAETILAGSQQFRQSGVEHLQAALELAPGSDEARQAERLLAQLGEAALELASPTAETVLREPPAPGVEARPNRPQTLVPAGAPGVPPTLGPEAVEPEPIQLRVEPPVESQDWPGFAGLVRRGLDVLVRLCRPFGRLDRTVALVLWLLLLPLGWVGLGWLGAHAAGHGSGPFDLRLEGEEQLLGGVGGATLLLTLPFVLWFSRTAPGQDYLSHLSYFGLPLSESSGALSFGSALAALIYLIALAAMIEGAISEAGMGAATAVAAGVVLAQVCYWHWSAGSLILMHLLMLDTLLCLALATAMTGWARYDAEELGIGALVVTCCALLVPAVVYGLAHLVQSR